MAKANTPATTAPTAVLPSATSPIGAGPTPLTFTGAMPGAAAATAQFPGSSTSNYSVLGITSTQARQQVQLNADPTVGAMVGGFSARTGGVGQGAGMTMSVADALANFSSQYASDPAFASGWQQQLWDAGLFSNSVYNSGQITTGDVYAAYKTALLRASSTHVALDTVVAGLQQSFSAQGGAKVKLPAYRVTIPLTSYEDMSLAADRAFEQVLGHRAPDSIKQALTKALNVREQSAGAQKAQGDLNAMLAWKGLNPDGTPSTNPTDIANQGIVAGQQGQAVPTPPGMPSPQGAGPMPTGAPNAPTVGGLPTQVTNAAGAPETITQGPVQIPYAQAPTAEALAYNTAMQANPNEVRGRTIAAAMNAIAQFIGQK
jgi:hypothetical protein